MHIMEFDVTFRRRLLENLTFWLNVLKKEYTGNYGICRFSNEINEFKNDV